MNAGLAAHQRGVLEKAIAFIDQLGRGAVGAGVGAGGREDDGGEEGWRGRVDTGFGRGELVGLVVACELVFSVFFWFG